MGRSVIHVETRRTARVEFAGENESAAEVWIVLHGYAETAGGFLDHFEFLGDGDRLFVAPEGLSRFYKRGMRGRVGASWMTSRDRRHEIRDYISYLDQVYQTVPDYSPNLERLNVLGFSQGVATAARWAARGEAKVDHLVLWGAVIPEDVASSDLRPRVDRLTVALGRQDAFIAEGDIEEYESRLAGSELNSHLVRYDGAHNLDPGTLRQIVLDA